MLAHRSSCLQVIRLIQWPFKEPIEDGGTDSIYKAYIKGLCKGISIPLIQSNFLFFCGIDVPIESDWYGLIIIFPYFPLFSPIETAINWGITILIFGQTLLHCWLALMPPWHTSIHCWWHPNHISHGKWYVLFVDPALVHILIQIGGHGQKSRTPANPLFSVQLLRLTQPFDTRNPPKKILNFSHLWI